MKWKMETDAPVQLALLEIDGVTARPTKTAYDALLDCAANYRRDYGGKAISEIPGVQAARRFFRAIGIEPTRRRPSSEALLQRAMKKKPMYAVNTVVDVSNWCSLDFLLPICAYDAGKLSGDVVIRIGKSGDGYEALNHREINLENRYLLADDIGPFGSPMTDSKRSAISEKTQHIFLGIFAPADYEKDQLLKNMDIFAERIQQFCGGEIRRRELLK